MRLLAIETSCDDTSIALLQDGCLVTMITKNQHAHHAKYAGIVPEIASRQHSDCINTCIQTVLKTANWHLSDCDAIAVTYGPGLEGSLLVGVSVANTLGDILAIPVIPVNHLHGHVYAAHMTDTPQFPALILLVSGGHSLLATWTDWFEFTLLGQTRDDAVGEAFDKVARLLGLGYPGGPELDRLASTGQAIIPFPKGLHKNGLDFSYSGLKAAVYRQCQSAVPGSKADIAASFQKAACDSLLDKVQIACEKTGINRVILCGGVSANTYLRAQLAASPLVSILAPLAYCTDNAAMIGRAAYYAYQQSPERYTRSHRGPLAVAPAVTL